MSIVELTRPNDAYMAGAEAHVPVPLPSNFSPPGQGEPATQGGASSPAIASVRGLNARDSLYNGIVGGAGPTEPSNRVQGGRAPATTGQSTGPATRRPSGASLVARMMAPDTATGSEAPSSQAMRLAPKAPSNQAIRLGPDTPSSPGGEPGTRTAAHPSLDSRPADPANPVNSVGPKDTSDPSTPTNQTSPPGGPSNRTGPHDDDSKQTGNQGTPSNQANNPLTPTTEANNPGGKVAYNQVSKTDSAADVKLKRLFGGQASSVKKLQQQHPDMSLVTIKQLQATDALDPVLKALSQHPTWNSSDVIETDCAGHAFANPILQDPEAMQILATRPDLKPDDVSELKKTIENTVGSANEPRFMAKAKDLLATRPGISTLQVGSMIGDLANASSGGGGNANPGATYDMFSHACNLLETRTDIQPNDIGHLAVKAKQTFGGQGQSGGGQGVAKGFDSVCDLLENDKGMSVDGAISVMGTLQQEYQDPGQRVSAMKQIATRAAKGGPVEEDTADKQP